MLSLQDCLDLTDLSDAELVAIARHENIPPIVALELGHRLIQSAAGVETLREFILDDIMSAQLQHRCRDCEQFSRTLAEYNEKHPERRDAASGQVESLDELLAIGQVSKSSDERQMIALREVQEAKDSHDCCACGRLSLGLVRFLESIVDAAVLSKT